MKIGLSFLILILSASFPVPARADPSRPNPYEGEPELSRVPMASGNLDAIVFSGQRKAGIRRANICSDAVFVRRVFLDVIGTLPTASEAKAFLEDKSPDKRQKLIDRLLEREEFAEYWGMRFADLLRVKSEFPVNLWPNAAQAYDKWIRDKIRLNAPYSQIAREILTASGSNFRDPAVNFYRSAGGKEPVQIAGAVALAFLGSRIEKWPESSRDGFAKFFSEIGFKKTGEWKEEIVYFSGIDGGQKGPETAILPDGTPVRLEPGHDPRAIFAEWLLGSKNSPFPAVAANRIWYWLVGRGIVQEPDDMRPDNPASNPELLAYLAREFAGGGYDIKKICRLILNSNTYQLSSIPQSAQPCGAEFFASYPIRRLDAEVLIDAINQITGSSEEYSSMIPEPFTWIPRGERSISLPDGSVTSSFLDLFGRPPRDTGFLSERNNKISDAQRLHLLNSSHIQSKIAKSAKLRDLFKAAADPRVQADGLYLAILSRHPTDGELQTIEKYSKASEAGGQQTPVDVAWALINSPEFLYRH